MPKAMVVDDSRAIRMILARTLRDLGFEVQEAANGSEALDRLGAGVPPDLIMADWNMPVMDGLELLRAIRDSPTYGAVPVVMVTTEAEIEQMSIALAAGATEYVMKPFTPDVVYEKLELLGL